MNNQAHAHATRRSVEVYAIKKCVIVYKGRVYNFLQLSNFKIVWTTCVVLSAMMPYVDAFFVAIWSWWMFRGELECCQRNPLIVVLLPPDHVEQKRESEQTFKTDIHWFILIFRKFNCYTEEGLELKIILNATKRCIYYLGVWFVDFILKQINYCLGTDFIRCDRNDATIHYAVYIRQNIVYYVISFREGC